MAKRLLSVGLDVGTTTTQMILSAISVENQASGFAVPEMTITDREILYKSPVHFTPLKGQNLVDGEALRSLLTMEYQRAGIRRTEVDTGAIIITGETSRKENAATVLQALSDFAGDFVVATAGPDLESILAAKGAGATEYSEKTGKFVLHMDIGGGTSNLALIRDGKIIRTGCLNVGGRLLKLDERGTVSYISPVLHGICSLSLGERPTEAELWQVAKVLCRVLEMAAGKEETSQLLGQFSTKEADVQWQPPTEMVTLSFSGGVADCIGGEKDVLAYGDLGPLLGKAIRESRLCQGDYRLGEETIRATVIGAGCHSTRLSGSTVFCRNMALPKKNLPVLLFTEEEQNQPDFARLIGEKLSATEEKNAVLAMPGYERPDYEKVTSLAEAIAKGVGNREVYVCLQGDMAKALGQKLSMLLPPGAACLCLDKLKFGAESYLDIGVQVGPCFPVVIKTLVLSNPTMESKKGEGETL